MCFYLFDAQVTENEKVSTVKELVSERLNIPPSQQRLLYKGKALAGMIFHFQETDDEHHHHHLLSYAILTCTSSFSNVSVMFTLNIQ